VKAELRKNISSGEYTVGQQIASKKVPKLVWSNNEDGKVVRTEFVV
jgi:hypothetical protein